MVQGPPFNNQSAVITRRSLHEACEASPNSGEIAASGPIRKQYPAKAQPRLVALSREWQA